MLVHQKYHIFVELLVSKAKWNLNEKEDWHPGGEQGDSVILTLFEEALLLHAFRTIDLFCQAFWFSLKVIVGGPIPVL